MEQTSFWTRVKQQVKAHRYSQKRLADYIEVPVQTLWGWIHYNRIPDAETACCIAEALGVTVEYLVRGNDDINAGDKMEKTYTRKTATEQISKLAQQIGEEAERLRV